METAAASFEKHRLNNWTWRELYRVQLGAEVYDAYFNRVWQFLDSLKANQCYDIRKVTPENRDLFIKICCQYILAHKSEYELSNDYTKIIRRECLILPTTGPKSKNNS